jgi:hypothetical protein
MDGALCFEKENSTRQIRVMKNKASLSDIVHDYSMKRIFFSESAPLDAYGTIA